MKKNKIIKISLLFFSVMLLSFFSINVNAKEVECNYNYAGKNIKYIIKNNKLVNPIVDGEKIENKKWYNSESFNTKFVLSSKSNNKTICPTIVVEENDLFNTIFVNYRDNKNCNGSCKELVSTNDSIRVEETKIFNAIGIYKKESYFIPSFRRLSDNTIEWSIDDENYYGINEKISTENNSIVKIDEKIIKNLFTNNDKSFKIYRCIFISGKKMIYHLTSDENSCANDLSKNDNQGYFASAYYNLKGADNCKNTVLGSTNDSNSVAWLLQKILSYIKILGPMLILTMSAVDFTKAIVMGDDETMQKCYKKLIKRLVLAIALFFVPTLVTVLLNLFGFMGDPICVLD